MAKIITVTNNKGGQGKTVTAINTAAALRLRGYDVLLVDFDGQANLTAALRIDASAGTTYDLMKSGATVPPISNYSPKGSAVGRLHVLPSCRDLAALEVELAAQKDRIIRLKSALDQYREKYDYIIVDTPPSLGILTVNALYAADVVIIPCEPEFMAVQGLIAIQDTIRKVAVYKPEGLPFRVLFTRYDKRKGLHRITIGRVEASGVPTFATRIRSNVALGEAPAVGVDIFDYAPNCYGSQDYNDVAAEVQAWTKVKHVRHKIDF